MGGACSTNGEKRDESRLLEGKPEGMRPLGRPRRRWVDNIEMDLGEVGWSRCGLGLVRSKELGKFKISPYRVSNPRPSGLWA
jgi:hypothetical protein